MFNSVHVSNNTIHYPSTSSDNFEANFSTNRPPKITKVEHFTKPKIKKPKFERKKDWWEEYKYEPNRAKKTSHDL